ncbi:MAG TPA: galactonate dehydratase [Planctomycetaceae bacterium]|nr:galactonate dehydratase [Planctomycetaceae bacterium]
MTRPIVHLHPDDSIVVAARDLTAGESIDLGEGSVVVRQPVGLGHKLAIAPVAPGAPVRKYGQVIGYATLPIEVGDHVHSHNLTNGDAQGDPAPCTAIPESPARISGRTFLGYRRHSGKIGTRNYLAVISTVNCSATVSKAVARHFTRERLAPFPHVDGVIALTHHGGCAMQYQGQGHKMLNRVLGGMARHPNIGGYLLIGLGCEQVTIGLLMQEQKLVQLGPPGANGVAARSGPPVFVMQDLGGTAATISAAIAEAERLLPLVDAARREPCDASALILGTECGGSDGNSGVTANPAVGIAADRIVACGGTAILSETTEIFGAEHLLTRRARTPEIAAKLLERIAWWRWYAGLYGVELDNNPSVGNKAGGLTTIAEKSLGAVAKGGSTALEGVYDYAEPIDRRGFVVMDTPGYDPPSVTGMVAGGANLIVFTTGRGSCFGCKPVPSLKVASNSPMYRRMEADMDVDAGTILDGESIEAVGERIFEKLLATASGEPTKSEAQGIGDEEFVPWIVGPVL